jgi:hypothetical protein
MPCAHFGDVFDKASFFLGGHCAISTVSYSSAHQPHAGGKYPYDPSEVAGYSHEQECRAVRDRETGRPGREQQASPGHAEQQLPPGRQPFRVCR